VTPGPQSYLAGRQTPETRADSHGTVFAVMHDMAYRSDAAHTSTQYAFDISALPGRDDSLARVRRRTGPIAPRARQMTGPQMTGPQMTGPLPPGQVPPGQVPTAEVPTAVPPPLPAPRARCASRRVDFAASDLRARVLFGK